MSCSECKKNGKDSSDHKAKNSKKCPYNEKNKKSLRSTTNIDERHIANANNDAVETVVYRHLKKEDVSDEITSNVIPCGANKFKDAINNFHKEYPELSRTVEHLGGLNSSKDYTFKNKEKNLNIETKKTKKIINNEIIKKTPWIYYCEFLQGQLKNKEFQKFLKDYSEEKIIKSYYEKVIIPYKIKNKIDGDIDFKNYLKTLYVMGAVNKEKMLNDTNILVGARNLMKHILKMKNMTTLWKNFQNEYMKTHRLDDIEFEKAIKERLLNKDIWICIGKNDTYIVEGPQCISLKFKEIKIGKTTNVLLYDLELKKPSDNLSYLVKMEFRLHWKNGGQGVGNPNFMLK